MNRPKARHIPAAVVRELRSAARDRCCIRGHLIPEDELNDAVETDTLHLHHIVFFAEGGPNTDENLMLVCPACHAKIHKQPERYPRDELREAKRHWVRMRELVPQELGYETEDGALLSAPHLTVPFTVESFNLRFMLQVPTAVTIGQLGRFIGNWILRPLVFYARTAPYKSILAKAHIGRVSLALKPEPDAILHEDLPIGDIPGLDQMPLIALTDVRMVHALMKDPGSEEPTPTETVTLRWRAQPRDLDLHFVLRSPLDRAHVWYREMGTIERYPWAKLSEDIRTGHGPEVLSFGLLSRGVYAVAVHNYSNDAPLAGCGATIELAIGDIVRTYSCPEQGDGRWWVVFEFDVERRHLAEINRISDELAS